MSGWIKLHRSMFDWEWYTDLSVCKLFLHLLMDANHEDNSYQGIEIKRGCLITGRKKLSVETGLTENQIRLALKKLESTNEITIKSSTQGTHIQILKYNDYQNNDSKQPTEQPTEQPLYKKLRNKEVKEAASAAAHEMNFTDQKNQVESFRDGTTDRWYEFTSIWITTEDPAILNKNTKKKYWDKLTTEIQESLIKMVKNLGSDMQYLKTVWISECFKNKGMNSIYLKEKIAYQKSKLNNKIDKANKDTTHNFSGHYE